MGIENHFSMLRPLKRRTGEGLNQILFHQFALNEPTLIRSIDINETIQPQFANRGSIALSRINDIDGPFFFIAIDFAGKAVEHPDESGVDSFIAIEVNDKATPPFFETAGEKVPHAPRIVMIRRTGNTNPGN